jgi:AraC family transcriptional regulator
MNLIRTSKPRMVNPPGDTGLSKTCGTDLRASWLLPEVKFRGRPKASTIVGQPRRLTVSRWKMVLRDPVELATDPSDIDGAHVVTWTLCPTVADLYFGQKPFSRGGVPPRAVLLTGPGQGIRSIQLDSVDSIRLYLDQELFAECFEALHRRSCASAIVLTEPKFLRDSKVAALMSVLADASYHDELFLPVFVESISLAITARLLTLDNSSSDALELSSNEGLVRWRLKRVTEYIEAHIDTPISLADLSSVAGLSRMHFASQFKKATGLSPHSYILSRKIDRSKALLINPALRVADVAQLVGFRTQGHFTTVFKKLVGDSPVQWREYR